MSKTHWNVRPRRGAPLAWLVVAGASAALVGCGGIGPGDYVVYRVAFSQEEQSAGCYPNGQIPPDVVEDTTSFRAAETVILYGGAEEKFYLDVSGETIAGVATDDGFAFDANSVDVSYEGLNDEVRTTDTRRTSIDVILDGAIIDGSVEMTHAFSCVGPGTSCGTPPPDYTCVTTFDFVGTEVEDVQLKHDV